MISPVIDQCIAILFIFESDRSDKVQKTTTRKLRQRIFKNGKIEREQKRERKNARKQESKKARKKERKEGKKERTVKTSAERRAL